MVTKLKCVVLPGMFDDEFIIEAQDIHGTLFSIFVHKSFINSEESTCQVYLIEDNTDWCLIKLPVESSNLGSYVRVLKSTCIL